MLKIFISYRRAETLAFAGRLGDRLRAKYGVNSIYLDVDTMPPGVDFREHIASAVKDCDVVLVLIGQRWIEADGTSTSRLSDPSDLVRIEIETALSRSIPVVPVLVGSAQMPAESELPASLTPLVYRNAFRIDEGPDFHHHIERLIRLLNGGKVKVNVAQIAPSALAPLQVATNAALQMGVPDAASVAAEVPDDRQRTSRANPAFQQPKRLQSDLNFATIHLTLVQGIAVTAFLLTLNSLLAALGSMLWGSIHYWPAYMVSALACAYFRYWGLAVAVLSPVVSSLLKIGGAPAYLYIPSNTVQGILVIAAFIVCRIEPSLERVEDKFRYLIFVTIMPSVCGAGVAWWLRKTTGVGISDPPPLDYTYYWVLENSIPAIFPGIWLHKVIGSLRRPFAWTQESYFSGWVGRTLEYTVPWTITIFLSISITLILVTSRLGGTNSSLELVPEESWYEIRKFADENILFAWLILITSVAILISVGFAVRHARQAWQLEQAVRRHMPNKEEAERILSGKASPSERKTVSLLVMQLNNFGDVARSMRPALLIDWLNAYFDCISGLTIQYGGQVDCFSPESTVIIFGSHCDDYHANSAVQCALEEVRAVTQLSAKLGEKLIPRFSVSVGVHSGPVVAGEVGPADRSRYTVVGDTVSLASQIAREAQDYGDELCPVLLSNSVMKEAGLSVNWPQQVGVTEAQDLRDGTEVVQLYAVLEPARLKQTLVLDAGRSLRDGRQQLHDTAATI